MKVIVVFKHIAKLHVFVGAAKFLPHKPTELLVQARFIAIELGTLDEKTDPLFHPVVAIAVIIEFDGYVVRDIVRLEVHTL